MNERFSHWAERNDKETDRDRPQPIGEILAELLLQYQARFPQLRIAVLQTPAEVL